MPLGLNSPYKRGILSEVRAEFRGSPRNVPNPMQVLKDRFEMIAPARAAAELTILRRYMGHFLLAGLFGVAAVSTGIALAEQAPTGPQTPPKVPDIVRLPANPSPEKSPLPAEEIIRQFAMHEDEFARARDSFVYKKTVRLEEMGPDGKPAGQTEVVTSYTAESDGTWRPRTARKPDSTLQIVDLEPDALQML